MNESIIVGSPINAPAAPAAEPVATEPATAPQAQPAPQTPPKTLELGKGPERPDWLPAEYKTPQDFRKAHDDLRAKLSGKEGEKVLVTEQDLAGYMQEVVGTGALSDASRRQLHAKGFSDGLIDQHVAGLQAIREGQMGKLYAIAGGPEGYAKVAEWANGALSADEQSAYNAAVNSGNPQIAAMAVSGLKARFDLAGGGAPAPEQRPAAVRLSGGAPSGSLGVKMFGSMAEQVKAQADPRYAADPNFRREVEKMIDASIKAGRY